MLYPPLPPYITCRKIGKVKRLVWYVFFRSLLGSLIILHSVVRCLFYQFLQIFHPRKANAVQRQYVAFMLFLWQFLEWYNNGTGRNIISVPLSCRYRASERKTDLRQYFFRNTVKYYEIPNNRTLKKSGVFSIIFKAKNTRVYFLRVIYSEK